MNINYDSLYNSLVSQSNLPSISNKVSQTSTLLGSSDFSTVYDQAVITQQNKTLTGQSVKYEDIFQEAAQQYGISASLLKAVAKAESGFDANAVSSCGAKGIMQLMPGTAAALGVVDVYDPKQNIMGGAKYLSQMVTRYDGDVKLALAAYNAGPGNVKKYGGVPPFKETQNYITKVLGYAGDNKNIIQSTSVNGFKTSTDTGTNSSMGSTLGLQNSLGSTSALQNSLGLGSTSALQNSLGLGNTLSLQNSLGVENSSSLQNSLASGIVSASKGDSQQITTLFLLQLLEMQNKSAGNIGSLDLDEG